MNTLAQAFYNAASDTTKRYSLESFCFTYQFGLNIYFNDYDDLQELLSLDEVELEFWALYDSSEQTDFKVSDFKTLQSILEMLENAEDSDDVTQYLAIIADGYVKSLDDAKEWHNNSFFSREMTKKELGQYFVDEGLMGDIPDNLINYIDYESLGRDLMFDYVIINGNMYYNN